MNDFYFFFFFFFFLRSKLVSAELLDKARGSTSGNQITRWTIGMNYSPAPIVRTH